MSRLPNFIVAGAMKGGTCATRANIARNKHQEVFVCNQAHKLKVFDRLCEENDKPLEYYTHMKQDAPYSGEIDYFSNDKVYALGEDYYKAFFDVDKKIIGDISPNYMYLDENPETHKRMHALIPDCKIIFILRDPIKRAFSHWNHLAQLMPKWSKGLQEEEFYDTIIKFPEGHNSIRNRGLYHNNIVQYMELFGQENVKVYQQEALQANTRDTLTDIIRFAGAQKPMNNINMVNTHTRQYYQTIDERSHKFLQEFYADEVANLKKLLPYLDFTLWNNY